MSGMIFFNKSPFKRQFGLITTPLFGWRVRFFRSRTAEQSNDFFQHNYLLGDLYFAFVYNIL